MDILRELIKIISPNKLKKINLIHNLDDDAKLKQLYMGKHQDKWNTDTEAIEALYGSQVHAPKFAKLKYDLTQRLLQIFPLINLTKFDEWEYRKATWECYHINNTALMLAKFTNAHGVVKHLYEKYLDKFLYYEFTELVVAAAEVLNAYTNTLYVDKKKAIYYRNLAIEYSTLKSLEVKGKLYLNEMYGYYAKDKSVKKFVPELALQYMVDLDSIKIEKPTQYIIYYKRMLRVIYYMSQYKYADTLEVCEEAITFFKQQSFHNRSLSRSFYLQAIACSTYTRNFERGYQLINEILPFAMEESLGWYKAQETYFQLAMYARNYLTAYTLHKEITNLRTFADMPDHVQQWWKLQEGYLYLLSKLGQLELPEKENIEFRFYSFINSIPVWTGDKRGLNFSIHVLQLTHLILQNTDKAFETYINRIEPMRTYVQRYAGNDEMHRSRLMVRIFDVIAENGFIRRKYNLDSRLQTAIYHLINEPYDLTDTNLDVEPLPFQDMYDYILGYAPLEMEVEYTKQKH